MRQERRYVHGPVPRMTTTLWDYSSANYPGGKQGDADYVGATPSYVVWNLLDRYTQPGEAVLDPMCGSGTTLDVAKDLGRVGLGYDLQPQRPDILEADARRLPLDDGCVDFIFVDPPYSNHIRYSGRPECIGELDARVGGYFEAMDLVFGELDRVLRSGRHLAVYVSDSAQKGREFVPIGITLFGLLQRRFEAVDHVAVVRHNKSLKQRQWHIAAQEGNYFLRGFNHLLIFRKG